MLKAVNHNVLEEIDSDGDIRVAEYFPYHSRHSLPLEPVQPAPDARQAQLCHAVADAVRV